MKKSAVAGNCVFCERIVTGDYWWEDKTSVAFFPLNPVVPGHILVVPKRHVKDFTVDETVSGDTMRAATFIAKRAGGQWNLITSKGPAATQTIMHLHIHLVQRLEDDGLHLPWTGQKK